MDNLDWIDFYYLWFWGVTIVVLELRIWFYKHLKLGYDLDFCQSIWYLGYVWLEILNNFGYVTSYV